MLQRCKHLHMMMLRWPSYMNWKIFQVLWICFISSVLWAKSVLSAWTQKEHAANEWLQQHQYANMPFAYYQQSNFDPSGIRIFWC